MTKCKTCNDEIHVDCDHNQGRCPHRAPTIDVRNPCAFFFSLMGNLMLLSAGVALFMATMHPLHVAAAGFLVVSAVFRIIGDVLNG